MCTLILTSLFGPVAHLKYKSSAEECTRFQEIAECAIFVHRNLAPGACAGVRALLHAAMMQSVWCRHYNTATLSHQSHVNVVEK